jgi:hypothetical protein
MVRAQAAFHSALLMCVSRSQKPMQSASDLPPPPGALGADSLGLGAEEALDDSARLGCATPPPVANCVCSCGERGAMGASSGSGAAIADGGVTRSGGGGDGELPNPEIDRAAAAAAAAAELPFVGVTAELWVDCGLLAIAGDVRVAAAGERGTPFG